MKTVSDVIAYIRRTFGDEASIQVTDADIIRWTNAAQRDIVAKNKILKQVATSTLVAGQSDYDFSALPIYQIHSIYVDGHPVEARSFQNAQEYIAKHDPNRKTTGRPQVWYSWGNELTFWPTPSAEVANGIKIYYIAAPVELTATTSELSVPDEYFNRVIEFVMAQAYELDEDNENASYKHTQFSQGLDVLAGDQQPIQKTYPLITILPEDMEYYG